MLPVYEMCEISTHSTLNPSCISGGIWYHNCMNFCGPEDTGIFADSDLINSTPRSPRCARWGIPSLPCQFQRLCSSTRNLHDRIRTLILFQPSLSFQIPSCALGFQSSSFRGIVSKQHISSSGVLVECEFTDLSSFSIKSTCVMIMRRQQKRLQPSLSIASLEVMSDFE